MLKILVCDDEIKIRTTLYDYFTAKGYSCKNTDTGVVFSVKGKL